jgi:glycosyltransferase involved in cell wall biosynthesis
VLRRADGVKVLFPGLADSCAAVNPRLIRASFFAYVDLTPFRNLEERKEILFVGFPFRLKGVDILVEAFKRIAPKYPDWKLKIMGWYPEREELDLHMGGHPQIFHQPPVLHSQIHLHIGACGMLVLPSRTEAMGRVLLEAMAAGKPRIGSDVDGIPTVIDNGKDGLLFKAGDAGDLAAKMDLLMGDPELRRSMGQRGAERARTEFTSAAYFSKLTDFYSQVLSA